MTWYLLALGLACGALALALGPVYLKRKREQINSLWDDMYFLLRERYLVLRALAKYAPSELGIARSMMDDVDSRLRELEETNDVLAHADIQNALLPILRSAIQQCHEGATIRDDSVFQNAIAKMNAVESRLVVLRDRYNRRVHEYNELLNRLPFSIAAYATQAREKPFFPILIPWWSTDAAEYGGEGVRDVLSEY